MTIGAGSIRTIRRGQVPRREPRKTASDAPRQPHIKLGMWVRVERCCGFSGCKRLDHQWHKWQYLGPIVAKRGNRYLVECTIGMGKHWATRDQMYVRDLTGRYWNQPLLVEE